VKSHYLTFTDFPLPARLHPQAADSAPGHRAQIAEDKFRAVSVDTNNKLSELEFFGPRNLLERCPEQAFHMDH